MKKDSPISRDSLSQRAGTVWDYISPSRLKMWLACPFKFKLKYIDGIETPPSPALFLGKAVHSGLETFYRHRQLGVTLTAGDVAGRLVEAWGQTAVDEKFVFETVAHEQACRAQAVLLVTTYLEQLVGSEPVPLAVEVAAEAALVDPQSGEDLGIPLVGVMDLVLPDGAGPLIVDFKTTGRSGEPLEMAHEIQLSCYSYLFRRATGGPEGSLEIRNLVKTRAPKVQFHRYAARDQRHWRRLFAVIRAYLDDLDSGTFLFRPGLGCTACDYRRVCAESL